jgi:hypothetical protein
MPIRDPIDFVRHAARNSPWLVMSVLAHLMLLVALGFVVIRHGTGKRPNDGGLLVVTREHEEPTFEPVEAPVPTDRTRIPPNQPGEVVDQTPVYVPSDLVPQDFDPTQPIGDPLSTELLPNGGASGSTAIGVGTGGNRGNGPSPWSSVFPGRTPLPPKGVKGTIGRTFQIDKAVRDGLIWLCRHQNPDGSWSPRSLPERCDPQRPCFDPKLHATVNYDEGLTSLALLSFLGAGFSNLSQQDLVDSVRAERHRIGEVVKKGLVWLRARQNTDGSFSRDRAFMYNEALATMALSEAYGLTGNRTWKDPAQRGVDFLEKAQRPSPSGSGLWGWRYASRGEIEDFRKGTDDASYPKELFDSDTSVTTWCVMALKSAQLCGLQVRQESMDGAVEFCKFVTASDGLVGYLDAKTAGQIVTGPFDGQFTYHPTTMSALGMCIRIFARHDAGDPFLDQAAKRILLDLPTVAKDHASLDYYYWYYASLALNQLDGPDSPKRTGKYWNTWNQSMVDAVLTLQDHTDRACTSGGWIASDRWGSYSGAGPLYATALNVLTLEVYYRYPNAFGTKRN